MKIKIFSCVVILLLIADPVFARTVTWDLSGVTDEGSWSSYQGNKVAIAFYVNGTEIGRVWDDPSSRTADITMTLPKYYILSGKLFFYAAPYPATPADRPPEPINVDTPKYRHRYRMLDDDSTAEIKENRVRGRGIVSFGPTK